MRERTELRFARARSRLLFDSSPTADGSRRTLGNGACFEAGLIGYTSTMFGVPGTDADSLHCSGNLFERCSRAFVRYEWSVAFEICSFGTDGRRISL